MRGNLGAGPAATGWRAAGLSLRAVWISVLVGLAGFVFADAAESVLIRGPRPILRELEWTSDALLAVALATVSFLWLNLKASRARVERLERQRIVLDTQLEVAAEIQRNLLPRLPAPRGDWRWAARLEQAGRVGGDFYDFLPVGSDGLLIFIADVSGKGIPAGLILSGLRARFRQLADDVTDPAELLSRLSRALYEDDGGNPYATGLLVRLDLSSRRIAYVNAGHPPGLILGSSGCRLLSEGGPPLGLLPSASYRAGALTLEPGDLAVLVTDGVTEALEGRPETPPMDVIAEVVAALPSSDPNGACEAVLRLARGAPGPPGVPGWQDDRTAVAFGLARPWGATK